MSDKWYRAQLRYALGVLGRERFDAGLEPALERIEYSVPPTGQWLVRTIEDIERVGES